MCHKLKKLRKTLKKDKMITNNIILKYEKTALTVITGIISKKIAPQEEEVPTYILSLVYFSLMLSQSLVRHYGDYSSQYSTL